MNCEPISCPLCKVPVSAVLFAKKAVAYYSCAACGMVFMDPAHRPTLEIERERYSQHNNDGSDKGYVEHLMDIGGRVRAAVSDGAQGLDYGCGPAPVMAAELHRSGVACDSYDPIFAADADLLKREYDFVTCCEAFEHFHRPAVEMIKLYNLLKEGGVLGIKTSLISDGIDYESWYYANDWTHVVFLRAMTVEWIALRFCLELIESDDGRIVFRKKTKEPAAKVAAGLVSRDGKVLLARRAGGACAGRWEFPGGKLREGEDPLSALERELKEELGLEVSGINEKARIEVPLADKWLELVFVEGQSDEDPNLLTVHSEWRWVETGELGEYDLLEGDKAFSDMYL